MRDDTLKIAGIATLAAGGIWLLMPRSTGQKPVARVTPRTPTPSIRSYVAAMSPIARLIEAEGGPPAIFGLAQGALESANGSSSLARRHHNHFGIKAGKSWSGAVVNLPTREVKDRTDIVISAPFRAYPGDEAGWRDWAGVARRVATRGGLPAGSVDPRTWAESIARGGWATEPRYAEYLRRRIDLIEAAIDSAVSGPRRLGARDVARIARGAGFSGGDLVTMTAIGLAESEGDPAASNAGNIGIWQVAADVHDIPVERLKDPIENALVARGIWSWAKRHKPTPYQPWGAYNDGRYRARLAEAASAVKELPV